jgi:hypothetical protein
MSKTYGEMLDKLVDAMARYDDRADIFRRNDILKGHFYNVINPDRKTSGGNAFHTPIEWMVKLTRDSGNYSMIKQVATDCKCAVLTPEDIEGLKTLFSASAPDPLKVMHILHKIINGEAR